MEFTGTNGKTIVINAAGFKDAFELKNSIEESIKGQQLDLVKKGTSLENMDIAPLIQLVLSIDSNERFNTALFKCLEKCLYDQEKITEKTFEKVENRADYYNIVIECVKVNISPFFVGLISRLKDMQSFNTGNQKPQ